ncbi:hypothetical protein FRC17_006441 [Serendipita sp. 399]|nr:hypothetical protein FRC17_006441 [Serendipita sp. 399]
MVQARPGAGKTATGEAVVAANPEVSVAVVTYSKRLQLDALRRLEPYASADVFTFHGIASRLFGEVIHNDTLLLDLRTRGIQPVWNPAYEILILDELQDLSENLYWLTCVLISQVTRALERPPRILLLGDSRQAIYDFRGADARYLQLAEDTFSDLTPYRWQNLKLSKSFRLSHATADFVNTFIGENYVQGSHHGPKPIYIHADLSHTPRLVHALIPLIKKYKPENTAIIAPSVRSNPILSKVTNMLSKRYHIPVAVSISDDAPLDQDVLHGKVTVTTYHQFKGSERDLVIVLGADAGYFRFIGRDLPDDRCPNATFVALTRAKKQLVVLQSDKSPAMPFVDWEALESTMDFYDLADSEPRPQYPPGRPLQLGLLLPLGVAATEVARHVQHEVVDELVSQYLDIKELASSLPETMRIDVADKVLTNEAKMYYEAVSDLNGLAVTAAFEWKASGTCMTYGYRKGSPHVSNIPDDPIGQARWFAEEAAKYEANVSNYKSRYIQMRGHAFDWLDGSLEAATARLSEQFPDTSRMKFEVKLETHFLVEDRNNMWEPVQKTTLGGRADIIIDDQSWVEDGDPVIWEIKFVSSLSVEHAVQAAIYGYLWCAQKTSKRPRKPNFPKLIVFNVRDGAKWEISTTFEDAYALIEGLLRAKYTSKGEISTPDFLEKCREIRNGVQNMMAEWDE